MTRPGLIELNAVVAVAAHRSFRKAAVELGVSASALSHAVASLEKGCLYCAHHNSYAFGGIGDSSGNIHIHTDYSGPVGAHTFHDGFLYGRAGCDTSKHSGIKIKMKKIKI